MTDPEIKLKPISKPLKFISDNFISFLVVGLFLLGRYILSNAQEEALEKIKDVAQTARENTEALKSHSGRITILETKQAENEKQITKSLEEIKRTLEKVSDKLDLKADKPRP